MTGSSEGFQKRLIAVEPWKASGPGWANGGVRAHFEVTRLVQRGRTIEAVTKVETEYLYEKDMTAEERLAFDIALRVIEPFRRRFASQEVGPHVR